jgi:hypothetical protein
MKTPDLVNGYVLPNLFYELIFLDEHGVDVGEIDWSDDAAVSRIIGQLVLPRFKAFTTETKSVVYNTMRYLLAVENAESEMWDKIWQACSAPIPTPRGVPHFVRSCYETLFANASLPSPDEVACYRVNHDAQAAIRLN